LDEQECLALVARWRREFLRAWQNGFFHCEAPDRFLRGARGRAAHFAWADIPDVLVKKWSAERRRTRSKTTKPVTTVVEEPAPAA
jgi:hypothetical protein